MPYLLFAELAVQIISFTATHAVNFCMNFFYYDVQLFLDIELTNSLLPPCCNLTGCCYSNVLKDSHRCVERAMHHNCPVCFEVSGLCSPWHFIISCYTILNSAVRDLEIKKKSSLLLHSICSTRRRTSACCSAGTRFIWSA